MVAISSFAAKFALTNDALQALLDILLLFLPDNCNLPKTTYFFKKFLPRNNVKVKYFCPECQVAFKDDGNIVYSFKCSCNETIYPITQFVSENCYIYIIKKKHVFLSVRPSGRQHFLFPLFLEKYYRYEKK